ncbi:hypothetical protein EDEG_03004 [Edhazardia aedis USNM 41457]|uniref:Trehalase n=1 Tax=Edhazardia aedis (strain USNM 41457) TaxID=1003232 RepID=J9DMN7_EDHAE|nr:hypothetical protein EDEG_03004 [Edhazardia aedis USNM 41457]|eukprot:EJW02592.1 hypothetical protein EDEG_03004 [Edhazardia aedis USNM 41457]
MFITCILFLLKQSLQQDLFDDVSNISLYTDISMLLAVQILLPNEDSKDFVDRATKYPLKKVVEEFRLIEKDLGLGNLANIVMNEEGALNSSSLPEYVSDYIIQQRKKYRKEKAKDKLEILNEFVESYFYPVGYDIEKHIPVDYKENPQFLENITDPKLKEMADHLNKIWFDLSRKSKQIPNSGTSSLLNLPYPFMIPGGRFREFYYWDTYWILEGLLVCDMFDTAENIVRNFIHIIDELGYIPNGTRKYYMYRSQPPYFPMMLLKLLDIDNGRFNDLILGEGLDMALKEYKFWDTYRKIKIFDKNGNEHFLNHFHVHSNFPRPESFGEDIITYERQKTQSQEMIYSNIKSGAESGWDFSSRWLAKEDKLDTIEAFLQVSVDLNAILYRNEQIIATLLHRKGENEKATEFLQKAQKRARAINAILWNPKENAWNDYITVNDKFVDYRFYFSNVSPLIYGITPPNGTTEYDIMKKYAKELFSYPGGIPASGHGIETGQQWDFPNVWAPHQHMIVEYLLSINEQEMAFHVAKAFFDSVYEGFKKNKAFFEKYNCVALGDSGAGGEYAPQTGFGWTNGTVLSFILKYGDTLMKDYDFKGKYNEILNILDKAVKFEAKNDITSNTDNYVHEITPQKIRGAGLVAF